MRPAYLRLGRVLTIQANNDPGYGNNSRNQLPIYLVSPALVSLFSGIPWGPTAPALNTSYSVCRSSLD